jgi:putative FmdB family regulatory protein
MPTYEYECKSCGHTFEAFQSMRDEPLKACPECGKDVRRLIFGGTGVIFKGSGFYVTDKSKPSAGTGKSAKAQEAPSSGGTGTEQSPAASAPAKNETSESASAAKASAGSGDKAKPAPQKVS